MKQIKVIDFCNKEQVKVGSIEFRNKSEDGANEIYFYGEIVSGDWKWEESDVTMKDFKDQLDEMKDADSIDIFINSPGGSVTAGVAMLNQLNRHNATKNVYIDSLAASITGVMAMCYTNLYVYNTSMFMAHKPYGGIAWGYNANDHREAADTLDRIEENMIIPAYLSKTTLSEDEIRECVNKTVWWGAQEIKDNFKNVTILDDDKDVVACIRSKDLLKGYKNMPKDLLNKYTIKPKSNDVSNQKHIEIAKAKLRLELAL